MPLHVELSRGEQFGERVTLIKFIGRAQLRYQFGGHGRAGLIVAGIVCEHGRIFGPVFVELRWEFDEITWNPAIERGIVHSGEHGMQCMAEFVEHRANVVVTDERGVAGRGFGEIADVVNDWQRAQQLRWGNESAGPGATLLVVALIVIAIEEGEWFSIGLRSLRKPARPACKPEYLCAL